MKYIVVSRERVLKQQRKRLQDQLARARYEERHPKRNHHRYETERPKRKKERDDSWLRKPFIMWDGEGPTDAGYALFGNSLGDEICHPFLSSVECLDMVLQCAADNPDGIHIAFGFNYDVSMILKDLPKRTLRALRTFTRCVWKGYEIEHIPHKWFKVKYGTTSCKIYDVRSFFAGTYLGAIESFEIGGNEERERIQIGKRNREIFQWSEINEIKEYWRTELTLGVQLMDKLREIFYDAGYVPRSWHGPGALARMALKRHNVYDAMKESPPEVQVAAQFAFAGGRFELFIGGHIQETIYNGDINSAYPHYATQLPNLAHGHWKYVRNFQPGKFGVYHIRYSAKPDNTRPFPLFCRLNNGSVVWPNRVTGWYWTPEAKLVANDPDASFIEGWVFVEDNPNDRPFAWLAEYYYKRKRLQNAGSPAEYTFKLIINAVYGQLAQRSGWDRKHRKAPRSHQLEWAGYITSACRAAVYRAATKCDTKLVSIDTDGVYSLAPISEIDCGNQLGQWKLTEYSEGIFWQSGMYCLKDDKGWQKAKSRGIKKGSYTADDLLEPLYGAECGKSGCKETEFHIHLARRTFYTYGLADQVGWDKHNTWADEPHVYMLGGSKRVHFPNACMSYCDPPKHRFAQWSPTYGVGTEQVESRRHPLPWQVDPLNDSRALLRNVELFNADDLDPEDLWVMEVGT